MGIFTTMDISASGLSAQRARMDAIANNIANASTTRTPEGGPYRRQEAVFAEHLEEAGIGPARVAGVETPEIVADGQAPRMVYDPGHPDANPQGYVAMPNVNIVREMTDMITATRAYEANVTAMNASKSMVTKALELGRG